MITRAVLVLAAAGTLLCASGGCFSHFDRQTIPAGQLPLRLTALVHTVWNWDVVRQNPGAEVVITVEDAVRPMAATVRRIAGQRGHTYLVYDESQQEPGYAFVSVCGARNGEGDTQFGGVIWAKNRWVVMRNVAAESPIPTSAATRG